MEGGKIKCVNARIVDIAENTMSGLADKQSELSIIVIMKIKDK